MIVRVLIACAWCLSISLPASAGTVLMLDQTVCTGCTVNEQSIAVGQGHTVTLVNAATWNSMTTAQFAAYNAIVIGDNRCGGASDLDPLLANRATWSAAITGNAAISTFDPTAHDDGTGTDAKATLIKNAINWAAAGSQTGLYLAIGCRDRVDVLGGLGTFTQNTANANNATIYAPGHPTMAGLTSATLSGWGQSYHGQWTSIPNNFSAVVRNTLNGNAVYVVTGPVTIVDPFAPIPTLSTAALGILALLVAGLGFGFARRRVQH